MNPATFLHNPLGSIEARNLTTSILEAPSRSAEQRQAEAAGLTLGQARAVALLVAAETEDLGVRRLLQRDQDFADLLGSLEDKLAEYAREETPALARFTAREILVLAERIGERGARLAAASRHVILAGIPTTAPAPARAA